MSLDTSRVYRELQEREAKIRQDGLELSYRRVAAYSDLAQRSLGSQNSRFHGSRRGRPMCGPEGGRQFVESLPRSRDAPLLQPATPALDVRAQKLHPLFRRGVHDDVSCRLTALWCPAGAVDAARAGAIVAEANQACDAWLRARVMAREVRRSRRL